MITNRQKPRICFLRGSYLNPYEIQYLEPLQDQFEIVVAHPGFQRYDLRSIKLPRITITCLDYLNGIIPRTLFNAPIPNVFKYLGYEEILLGLKKKLEGFDLVHVPEESFFFTWQVARLKKQLGYKLVTTHDEISPFWYTHRTSIVKRAAEVRSLTDLFLARSNRAKQALIAENVEPEKIRVIGHGVDVTRFNPAPRNKHLCRQYNISSDQFIILFVGRLVWTKGIFAFSDAINLLLKNKQIRERNPLFLFVGDGPERQKFESRNKFLGIQNYIKIVGHQPYDLLPDIHRLADMFVLPSISTRFILEQFGIVLIESMACGKPVVSTHCGAIDEVIGKCGILVQPNDYYRLSEAIEKLILDDDRRKELGMLGKERVNKYFTHEIIANNITSSYNSLL